MWQLAGFAYAWMRSSSAQKLRVALERLSDLSEHALLMLSDLTGSPQNMLVLSFKVASRSPMPGKHQPDHLS